MLDHPLVSKNNLVPEVLWDIVHFFAVFGNARAARRIGGGRIITRNATVTSSGFIAA